jgi:ABC-2 type transport system permease protein
MVPILILAGTALFVVMRRLRVTPGRRRPGSRAPAALHDAFSALTTAGGDVGLVAAREVRARVGGRVFRAGTLLMLAAAAAAIVIPVLERGRRIEHVGVVGAISAPARAALVSAGSSVGGDVRVVSERSAASARADLRSGRIDVAVVDGRRVLAEEAIAPSDTSTVAQLARAISRAVGSDEAVRAAGLSPAQAAVLAGARPLPVDSLQSRGISAPARAAAVVALVLLFVMLTQYNAWTLVGVMEEKATRVIEVLLAAVGPSKLLTGKVAGIGIVVFAQAAVVFGFAFGLARAVGSDLVRGTSPTVLVSALVWLVLGYGFYSWVYAAAGSMTERQSQVQTLAFPLALPVIFAYFVATTTLASGSTSTLVEVLAYLPPTAPFAVTVLTALGAITWWQFAISAALSLLCTVGVARLAMAVYRRSILRTGARVRLSDLVPLRQLVREGDWSPSPGASDQ